MWYDLANPDNYTKQLPSLQLGAGVTHVTALTGVVKEKASCGFSESGTPNINVVGHPTINDCPLSKAVKRIISIIKFKNGEERLDDSWTIVENQYAYGTQIAYSNAESYDTDADYFVVYETVAESTNCGVFSATMSYKDSLPETVEELASALGKTVEELIYAKAELANLKSVEEFEPTLLNGSTNSSCKIRVSNGYVEGVGAFLKGSLASHQVFLETEEAPAATRKFSVACDDSSIGSNAYVVVTTSGEWSMRFEGSPSTFYLDDVRFKAGD
ncbi:hypothetical protein ADUPG1_006271 [Aduncisulcus paluster]|uniref:Uncharacterized protein n=1 Tax=Aduncisulcus paluster TaxID=2918883 RepID=A0ABQ5KKH7_9EUKA|nr:hypothetical protein ADUPG1_006271 [Aduncisulcus paluster]